MTTNSLETLVPNAISSPVKHAYSDFYYTEMYIGTPPQKTNLALDTGSTLTWEINHFPAHADDHPLCVPPNLGPGTKGQNCVYGLFYYDRSSTYGPFGFDTFTFLSERRQLAIPNVAFGWGLFNKVNFNDYFHGHDNPIGGILGLGRGHPTGILQQLNQITLRRFSYCLPPQFEAQSLLHFGEGAQIGGPSVGSTPILGGPDDYYFTKLDAISLNGQRLQIDPSLFMAGGKGMAVDSGSPYSHIVAEAFKVLKQAVVDYFHNMYGWQLMTQKSKTGFDLCHQNIPTVFTSPSVTLHFEGADFVLHKPTLPGL
ncbi:aspartic proteinase CDR1-like [Prunus persica]|uniref:aspartic proteinase CDR1-like n=1 Tax=Prunus persica TaxID=3760 RepID=UPI0009AB3738|nr:aspartic proteinase CDR1-like [Prunus persica]